MGSLASSVYLPRNRNWNNKWKSLYTIDGCSFPDALPAFDNRRYFSLRGNILWLYDEQFIGFHYKYHKAQRVTMNLGTSNDTLLKFVPVDMFTSFWSGFSYIKAISKTTACLTWKR